MIKATIILIPTILLLAGCHKDDCNSSVNLTKEHQYFLECLHSQRQPTNNHEDDNGHFVDACETAAKDMAWSVVGKDCTTEYRP